MVTENHYRWDFIGLSTDEKPTPATSEKVVDGSTFYCSDTSKLYVFCKDTWYERKALGEGGGGGGSDVKHLTKADYNYHRTGSVDDGVALWLLDEGQYIISEDNPEATGIKLYCGNNDTMSYNFGGCFGVLILKKPTSLTDSGLFIVSNGTTPKDSSSIVFGTKNDGSGSSRQPFNIPVVNNLNDSSTDKALAANQGRILSQEISSLRNDIATGFLDPSVIPLNYDSTGQDPDNPDSYALWLLAQGINMGYIYLRYDTSWPIYVDNEQTFSITTAGVLTIIGDGMGGHFISFNDLENSNTDYYHIDDQGNLI